MGQTTIKRRMTIARLQSKISKLTSRWGYGPGQKLSARDYTKSGLDLSRLHLGCGNVHIRGWCNIDTLPTGATDLVCDIRTLPELPNACAKQIYACHVLEHFSHTEIKPILRRWLEVLDAGGELRLSVPDLDAITRIYQSNLAHFQIPGHQPWIALIYGGQKDEYDFHKTGFNFCWLKFLLEQVGFIDVERYSHEPHFISGVIDDSLAAMPFGDFVSLNVLARKPL
jgi:predicted SAM-dependent methyltransferase